MLIFCFLLSIIALILQVVLFPQIAILPFCPFLSLVMLRTSFTQALWLGCIAGVLMDLISSDPIGVHAVGYTLAISLLFRFKKHFLYEEPFHLSLLSALFSFTSTLLGLLLLFLFDRRVPLQGRWILTDLIGMPLIDGLFAFVWFAAPLSLSSKLKRMWDLFWLRRKKISQRSH